MDSVYKQTLDLIEKAVETIDEPERSRQLLFVVSDYIQNQDISSAHRVLLKVDHDFVVVESVKDRDLAAAVATILETFGLDLILAITKTQNAC